MRPLYLLAGCIVTSALVLAGCVGVGYTADRPDRFDPEPDPAQRVSEAVVSCKRFGYPVVRLYVERGVTRIRCGQYNVVVHEARIVKP